MKLTEGPRRVVVILLNCQPDSMIIVQRNNVPLVKYRRYLQRKPIQTYDYSYMLYYKATLLKQMVTNVTF